MENLGYYNGKFDLLENMKIPMNDRACYFGDGVYDAAYCVNHVIYACKEHIDRFFNSAGLLKIKLSYTKEELEKTLYEMIEKVDSKELLVYWQASRGTGFRSHNFPEGKSNLWIMIRPFKIKDIKTSMNLITCEDTRFLHCNIKTLNLIPSVMAFQSAVEEGCDEAVFHRGDRVTECAHSNISIIKDGILRTAPADEYILPGIARNRLIRMCKQLNIPVSETAFTVKDMMQADEVIVSSSGAFCSGVEKIDGLSVGGKAAELLTVLQDALMKEFKREVGLH